MRLGTAGHPASLQAAVRHPLAAAAAAAPGAQSRRLPSFRPCATAAPGGSGAERRRSRAAAAPPPAETAAAVGEEAPASPPAPSDWAARQQTVAPAAAEAAQQQGWSGLLGGLDADTVGKLCLLMVALLWGSYNPMLKVLYAQDGPPGPVAVMLFRGVIQASVLLAAYTWATRGSSVEGSQDGQESQQQQHGRQEKQPSTAELEQQQGGSGGLQAWLSQVPFTAIAASELGLWLFLATGIQTVGLQLTTATRAGFLIQATALLTPLLASFAGQKPSRNVWIGCMVALAGCLCIATDASAADPNDAAAFSLAGDAAILSSAFFFSLATVRLGKYARAIPAVELAAAKSLVLGGIAVGTFGVAAVALAAEGAPLSDLWPGYDNPLAWAIMIWSALGPGALAAFLHAKGQSVVPPADAQVIFSTTPLWSVAVAFLLLGGEPMSSWTVAGGAAVVAAGVIASRKDGPPADDKSGKQA